jgi:hypothetical protein
MNPKHAGKLAFLLVCCIVATSPVIRGYFFDDCCLAQEPKSEPIKQAEYPLTFKVGLKKGKEAVVALFVSSVPENDSICKVVEGKLASDIAKKLPQMAQECGQKLAVIEPSKVNTFKVKNPNWNKMHGSERGRMLEVDFVLDIHVDKMSLYQPGTEFYDGRADVTVDVYDVDAGPTQSLYHYVIPFKYPRSHVLDATTIPVNRFKKDFLERLAIEICNKHVEHKVSSGIAEEE